MASCIETQNITSNSTRPTNPLAGASIGIGVLSLAFIVGFPGNAFVAWTAICWVHKRTVTCLLILHLAIADLAVLLTAPLFLRFLSAKKWEMGQAVCQICYYICGVSMYASVYLIALMSLDRCLAVSKPFVSQKIRTRRTIRLLVLAIWVMSFFLAAPSLVYRKVVTRNNTEYCILCHQEDKELVFHNLFETITGFLLPFAIVVYSYGMISQRLKETRFRQKRRTSRLISLIVIAFALFWLPYHIVNLLDVIGLWSNSLKKAGKMARPILVALAFFSSSVNPILYTFSGGSLIRSSGIGFMAKLFEGTASEVSSIKHGTFRDRDLKTEPLNNGKPDSLTMSTNPTESSSPQEGGRRLKLLSST
ncbi:leukotriene B4 receptor 1 [Thamnophis elegans]|uniref:leukotriene B4 receptor 1 n=1 Tax=Thamnophis elegans TaxID=35005 RepID=UPI0013766304|nr:leukotriene B4 receptor 1 [Thamnophis elegans]XP_032090600.1 leukotriene B4 receptor 1 [Thamnophis elegans]